MSYSVLAMFNMNGKGTKEGFLKKKICDVVVGEYNIFYIRNK